MAQLETIAVPEGPFPGGHYSPAVVLGDLVFTAGQIAVDERGGAHRAARSTVEVAGLVKGLLVEIECVAARR